MAKHQGKRDKIHVPSRSRLNDFDDDPLPPVPMSVIPKSDNERVWSLRSTLLQAYGQLAKAVVLFGQHPLPPLASPGSLQPENDFVSLVALWFALNAGANENQSVANELTPGSSPVQSRLVPDSRKERAEDSELQKPIQPNVLVNEAVRLALTQHLSLGQQSSSAAAADFLRTIHQPIIEVLETRAKSAPANEAQDLRRIIAGLNRSDSALSAGVPRTKAHDPISQIRGFTSALTEAAKGEAAELQSFFDGITGHQFQTIDEKKDFTSELRKLFSRLNCRCECPSCGEPARLKLHTGGRYRTGIFQFQHGPSSAHGGSTVVPHLKLVPAPPDKRLTR